MMNLYIFNETQRRGAVYGIGTYIRELTAVLKDSDINVCVINLNSEKLQIKIEEIEGIKHWFFPAPISEQWKTANEKQWEIYHRNIVYLLQLHIEDKKNLIFHLNHNKKGNLAEELKNAFDCRIVATIHYFEWCFSLFGNVQRFRKILSAHEDEQEDMLKEKVNESYQIEKSFFKKVDHILCLSENTRQILHNDYQINPEKTTVIYNGLTDGIQTAKKQELRQKYGVPDIPIFLFVGRLDETKGLPHTIKAFKKIINSQTKCHLVIAGNGAFDLFLKECEDIWMHVTWAGLIGKDKLYDLYSITDIGVMPSFSEQCSYVAIEMMMHGIPLIATTGLKDMVEDGKTGLNIPVIETPDNADIDIELLAEKMLYLLEHQEERERIGANARRRYMEQYSLPIFKKNMLGFYDSLRDGDRN